MISRDLLIMFKHVRTLNPLKRIDSITFLQVEFKNKYLTLPGGLEEELSSTVVFFIPVYWSVCAAVVLCHHMFIVMFIERSTVLKTLVMSSGFEISLVY